MNAILNKLVPNRKVKIRLIRDDFSSPALGNVWLGREVTLPISSASNLVKHGYAEFVDESDATDLAKPDQSTKVGEPKDDQGNHAHAAAPAAQDQDVKRLLTLDEALDALNTEDDSHWTKSGLPDLTVLKEWTGQDFKRKDVETSRPDFTRETAEQ